MATKFKCSDGIYTVLKNGLAVAIDATAGTAIAAISGSGTFTVIRNGKVIASSALAAAAVSAIVADASNVVCPPECCMTAEIALDAFDLTVTTGGDTTSLSVRVTITHNEDTYSTAWEAAAASNVFDLTTLIVEVGGWFSGDTICIEYSYDETEIIKACCATVITEEYVEDDTYDLTELVGDCPFTQTSGFDLLYQNPDGGVTVSADGEMVVPDVDDDETVFVARNCNGCLTELLVLTTVNDNPVYDGRFLAADCTVIWDDVTRQLDFTEASYLLNTSVASIEWNVLPFGEGYTGGSPTTGTNNTFQLTGVGPSDDFFVELIVTDIHGNISKNYIIFGQDSEAAPDEDVVLWARATAAVFTGTSVDITTDYAMPYNTYVPPNVADELGLDADIDSIYEQTAPAAGAPVTFTHDYGGTGVFVGRVSVSIVGQLPLNTARCEYACQIV